MVHVSSITIVIEKLGVKEQEVAVSTHRSTAASWTFPSQVDFCVRYLCLEIGDIHVYLLVNVRCMGSVTICAKVIDNQVSEVEKVLFSVKLKITMPLYISVAMYLRNKRMKTKRQNLAHCASPGV